MTPTGFIRLRITSLGGISEQHISVKDQVGNPMEIERISVECDGMVFPIDVARVRAQGGKVPIIKYTDELKPPSADEMRVTARKLNDLADELENSKEP